MKTKYLIFIFFSHRGSVLPLMLRLWTSGRISLLTLCTLTFESGIPGATSILGFRIEAGSDLDFFKDLAVFVLTASFLLGIIGLCARRVSLPPSLTVGFLLVSFRLSRLSSLSQLILALRSAAACLSFSCLARDL